MYKISLFILIAVLGLSSVIIVGNVSAQSIPKPSVPEFTTIRLVDGSYDVPPQTSTTVDPFTGEQIKTIIEPGRHVERNAIEIKVKNQPFTNYSLGGTDICLFFNVSYKGHFGEEWYDQSYDSKGDFFKQSDSEYTTLSFYPVHSGLPTKGQMDFRVQAQIGHYYEVHMPYPDYAFSGEVSGWSSIHTLSIPDGAVAVADLQDPTPTPTVPELPAIAILPFMVVIPIVSTVLLRKRRMLI